MTKRITKNLTENRGISSYCQWAWVRNVSFLEHFVDLINKWSHISEHYFVTYFNVKAAVSVMFFFLFFQWVFQWTYCWPTSSGYGRPSSYKSTLSISSSWVLGVKFSSDVEGTRCNRKEHTAKSFEKYPSSSKHTLWGNGIAIFLEDWLSVSSFWRYRVVHFECEFI